MLHRVLSLLAILGVCAASLAAADDKKDTKKGDAPAKATITKVDAKAGTITVKMKGKDGKEVETTFKLTEDIRYFDSTGKAVAIDVFQAGNDVLVIEAEGKLKEVHKPKNVATANNRDNADREKIVGNWTVVSGQEDGKALPAEKVKGSHVVITKDTITVHEENNQKRVMSYKLDPSTTPRQIDLTTTEGSDKGKTSHGIYALEEDTLKICFALPGKDRPKEFTSKEGSKAMLFVMKRATR
jgi:uncharacterized protein (TIGR03067 family)